MEKIWDTLVDLAANVGGKLLYAALVLVIGMIVIKKAVKYLKSEKALKKLDHTVKTYLVTCIQWLAYVILIISVVTILGVSMTSVIALLTSASVAVGLALQGALSNLAGGIMILVLRPFKEGDFVEMCGISGTVKSISIVYTFLDTPDNKRVCVPNGNVMAGNVINYSVEGIRRVDENFAVAYGTNLKTAKDVLESVAKTNTRVLADNEITAFVGQLGDSAVVLTLRCWAKAEDVLTLQAELRESVYAAFAANGVKVPFPQLDVHLDK